MPPSPFLLSTLSLFFTFLTINPTKTTGTPSPANCTTSTCGDTEIRYPFWLLDTTSFPQCGYPGLGIECKSSNTPLLRLSDDYFYMKSIDYTNHTITLVDRDVATNSTCPRARHNLNLEGAPLFISPEDVNVTFYLNCSGPPPHFLPFPPIDCLSSGGKFSYGFSEKYVTDDFAWVEVCEEKIVTAVTKWGWKSGYGNAMNDGFLLDWRPSVECAHCEMSSGCCGYNNVTDDLCFCDDGTVKKGDCKGGVALSAVKKVIIGIAVAAVVVLSACIMHPNAFRFQWKTNDNQKLEAIIKQFESSTPRRYSYLDIKKMTKSLKDTIGKGGYGEVYKGYLSDGRPVAVKLLKATKGNGEEFINEVASISKTSHVNIVSLLGFCLDGKRRALIYEFLSRGSLEKYIRQECDSHMGLEGLYKIAIGVARGLEYLHGGCNTRILHFDIKPHNILLDEDFCPKISDFGLAKLCNRKESIVSLLEARGTIGYIAPEVFSRNFGVVSYRSDVYSYGMMVLEMVGARNKPTTAEISNSIEAYFPHWAYQQVTCNDDQDQQVDAMERHDDEVERKMILVGLWCIQTDPKHRPSMKKVIDMLEGSLESIEVPPKPFLYCPSTAEGASLKRTGSSSNTA